MHSTKVDLNEVDVHGERKPHPPHPWPPQSERFTLLSSRRVSIPNIYDDAFESRRTSAHDALRYRYDGLYRVTKVGAPRSPSMRNPEPSIARTTGLATNEE